MEPRLHDYDWATRGWTYQEAVLAQRSLLFCEDQVVFHCAQMIQMEAINSPVSNDFSSSSIARSDPQSLIHGFEGHETVTAGRRFPVIHKAGKPSVHE